VAPIKSNLSQDTSPPKQRKTNTSGSLGTSLLIKTFTPLNKFFNFRIFSASALAASTLTASVS